MTNEELIELTARLDLRDAQRAEGKKDIAPTPEQVEAIQKALAEIKQVGFLGLTQFYRIVWAKDRGYRVQVWNGKGRFQGQTSVWIDTGYPDRRSTFTAELDARTFHKALCDRTDGFSLSYHESTHENPNPVYPPLTAFKVTYDNGDVENHSMAAGVTLAQATAYYVGKRFEITETTFRTALAVEEIKPE